jgi:hypothetical protein
VPRRSRYGSFEGWGYGSDRVYVERFEQHVDVDLPTEDWHDIVLEDAVWFQEFGVPFDLRKLPEPMFQAHLAIIRGRAQRQHDEFDEEG